MTEEQRRERLRIRREKDRAIIFSFQNMYPFRENVPKYMDKICSDLTIKA